MKKENLFTILFVLFCAMILVLTIHGLKGNPTSQELNSLYWEKTGPFESSNERGRFALTYSIVEDGSLQLSLPLAGFSTPDLAITQKGQYVSLFAPGTAFLIIPGYILGKYFGLSQLGAFAVITLFAFLNLILIRTIAIRLGAHPMAANLGALSFIFASPAFTYGVTLSQHHITTFIVLFGVYLLFRRKEWYSAPIFWFLFGLSFVVDNPNIFFVFPIAIYFMEKIVSVSKVGTEYISIRIRSLGFLAMIGMVVPIAFFLWFNSASQGNYFQISGSLQRVTSINNEGLPYDPISDQISDVRPSQGTPSKKNVFAFFDTRNLINGFYIHFLSPDRGIVNYAPVVLLGVFGYYFLYARSGASFGNLLLAIAGFNILLYSMWGDPYGGWAFGSRYLIPTCAVLCIGVAMSLTHFRKNIVFIVIFLFLFMSSSAINTLGALTTNAVPPKIEILALEKTSGKEEKYTYERNLEYLDEFGSKSFIFQTYLRGSITARQYLEIIFALIAIGTGILVLRLYSEGSNVEIADKIKT